MKKIIFSLAICLLVAGSVSAQTYYQGPPRRQYYRQRRPVDDFYTPKVGIEAGVNIANTIDAYNSNYSTNNILGWHAGLTFDIPIIYPLSFAPEVLYSQKGFQADLSDGSNFTQRTNYIDVPLLAKFRIVPGFNFVIGPQLTFLLSTNTSFSNGFVTQNETNYNGNNNNNSYVAGVVGLSIDLNRNVELRARYILDLDKNVPTTVDMPNYQNQVYQFGIGIKFR